MAKAAVLRSQVILTFAFAILYSLFIPSGDLTAAGPRYSVSAISNTSRSVVAQSIQASVIDWP
jgi:hypothetical protein